MGEQAAQLIISFNFFNFFMVTMITVLETGAKALNTHGFFLASTTASLSRNGKNRGADSIVADKFRIE